MTTRAVVRRAAAVEPYAPREDMSGVDSDERLVEIWLSNRTPYTLRNYERSLAVFRSWRGDPLDLRRLTFATAARALARACFGVSRCAVPHDPCGHASHRLALGFPWSLHSQH